MPTSDPTPSQPNHVWLERFAARVIEKFPTTNPLDAVRHALSTFTDASDLKPEDAAEIYTCEDPSSEVGESRW